MAGYTVEDLLKQPIDEGAIGILHKPINLDQLLILLGHAKPDGETESMARLKSLTVSSLLIKPFAPQEFVNTIHNLAYEKSIDG